MEYCLTYKARVTDRRALARKIQTSAPLATVDNTHHTRGITRLELNRTTVQTPMENYTHDLEQTIIRHEQNNNNKTN